MRVRSWRRWRLPRCASRALVLGQERSAAGLVGHAVGVVASSLAGASWACAGAGRRVAQLVEVGRGCCARWATATARTECPFSSPLLILSLFQFLTLFQS